MPRLRRRAATALTVVVAAAVAGCGGEGTTAADPEREAFVEAEARALCAVQERAFATPAALAAAFAEAERKSGLAPARIAALKRAKARDVQLRQAISARVAIVCG